MRGEGPIIPASLTEHQCLMRKVELLTDLLPCVLPRKFGTFGFPWELKSGTATGRRGGLAVGIQRLKPGKIAGDKLGQSACGNRFGSLHAFSIT